MDPVNVLFNQHTGFTQFGQQRFLMFRQHILDNDIAMGHGSCNHIGTGLNTIGNRRMLRAMHMFYTFDANHIRACAPDTGSHLIQVVGQIDDFRFLRRILQRGGPFRQTGCHHDIFRGAYAGKVQIDVRAFQPIGSISFHKAMILGNLCT